MKEITDDLKPGSVFKNRYNDKKILLVLLPYWPQLVTPIGITSLKSELLKVGFNVETVDANVIPVFKEIYDQYFETLVSFIPVDKRIPGNNFYNVGNNILKDHMMAHIHQENQQEYIQLIKILIYKYFYIDISEENIIELNKVPDRFYSSLEKYFLELLAKEKPTVLGISVYNDTLPASMFAFKLTKERFPHTRTVMGGGVFTTCLAPGTENLSLFLEKTAAYIDNIIIGEGEILFQKLLDKELPDDKRVYTAADIKGEILDLSTAEPPDLSNIQIQQYPCLGIYASRSCPFQCSFCTEMNFWGKYRQKPVKHVVTEFIELAKKYKNQSFFLGDSLLNPFITDLSRELIKSDVCVYWDGYLRADKHTGNIENTLLWRRAGFFRARMGLESGSPRILELMGKRITVEQIKDALYSLAYAGIKTMASWIIGYPGETEEDFVQTLTLIEEMKDTIYEAVCNPFEYYLVGQVNSDDWARKNKVMPLFPQKSDNMLIIQNWELHAEPLREERYKRLKRFAQHLNKLGIPNPYSMAEFFKADERWKKLHKNAVPFLVELNDKNREITECRNIKRINAAQNPLDANDNGNWIDQF